MNPLALIPAAFVAGILMFLAPCTLPIVPGYLSFIAGNPAGNEKYKRRVLTNAIAFVFGFSIVFILLGTFAAGLGGILGPWHDVLSRIAGVIIIIFGLTMLGIIRVPIISQERHLAIPHFLTLGRFESSLLIGALFALGWSPCIGPVLGSILLLASGSATAAQGALLLGVFSLGLGVPFILTALILERAGALVARSGKLLNYFSILGGILLLVVGVLMVFGSMALFVQWGFTVFEGPYSKLLQYM